NLTPLNAAEIVTWFSRHGTARVSMVNLALVDPAGTVTFAGTLATAGLLLESATTTPSLGAGPLRAMVPVEELPPVALEGFSANTAKIGGRTVNVAVCVTPLKEAEIVIEAGVETAVVTTLNDALVPPAGTVTEGGTLATAGLLLASEIVVPPTDAAPLRVTELVAEFPPVRLGERKLSEAK